MVRRVARETPGLLAFTIPVHSYLGRATPVPTVAAMALLVTQRGMPEGEAIALLRATFEEMNFLELGSFQGVRISRARALEAIDLPLHPGADVYFASEGPQPATDVVMPR